MMIWLRSALFNLLFFLVTAGMTIFGLPLMLLPRRPVMVLVRFWAGLILWLLRLVCGVRIAVTGTEHLPSQGPALVAAKHQSAFDTIVWLRLLPDPAYVLKAELLRLPFWGWLARKTGMIAVDRTAGAAALRHLLRSGQEAAAAERQMVIFPEGTRVAPGARVPYQPGVAALATATGLPVIPVATDSGVVWGRRSFKKYPGTITIAVLPPLPARMKREALMGRLEAEIEAETDRLLAGRLVDKVVDCARA